MKRFAMLLSVLLLSAAAAASDDAYHLNLPFQGPQAVYTETNAADRNEILAYRRERDGDLRLMHRVATRGVGTGAGLGNQGALA